MDRSRRGTTKRPAVGGGMRRLIVGCGYLGSRVAAAWLAQGDHVFVLTRRGERARHLENEGFSPLIGDVTQAPSLPDFPSVDTLLWSVGFDRDAGQDIRQVYVDGLRNLLDLLPDHLGRIVYISSTGVYGQTDGGWVDESTHCQPRRAGGQACLAAEQLLLRSPVAGRVVILRLAGIYGPNRLPRLRQLAAGEPLDTAPEGMLNLIHVDDAAHAVTHVADLPLELPRVYLIADGQPVLRRTFYDELARLFGTPAPVFGRHTSGAAASSRSGGHKRVSNGRMRDELNLTLRYGSYREGLAAMVGDSRDHLVK